MFRLFLALLMAAFAAAAQNPLARPADPYSGAYANDQMTIELSRSAEGYTGQIRLSGQQLPVRARVAGEQLEGTFRVENQTYTFTATRAGSRLTLTTDGTTHVLERQGAAAAGGGPPSVIGVWQTARGPVTINPDGSAVIGDKTHRWTLDGNVIVFSGGGEALRVPFELQGNTWTWKFPDGQLVLTRGAAAAAPPASPLQAITGNWQGPNGAAQINPDGTAMVGGIPYRYVYSGNQLTLSGPDGTYVATVAAQGDSMTWTVNGKTLAFQRATAAWPLGGGSGTGAILPELVGKWCDMSTLNNSTGVMSRSACFTLLADGSYHYAAESGASGATAAGAPYGTASQDDDAGTWKATADTITATSRKTGVRTFRLEKRNHPKTGDPMLVLDGQAFVTAFQKAPWR
jgi:hypothetical protein